MKRQNHSANCQPAPRLRSIGVLAAVCLGWLAAGSGTAADSPKPAVPLKAAIVVENRAGPKLNDKILSFEDQVASRASGKDFAIISREDVLKATKVYRGADVSVISRETEVRGSGTVSGQANLKATEDRKAAEVGSAGVFPAHVQGGARVDGQVTTERNATGVRQVSGDVNASGTRAETLTGVSSNPDRNTLGTKSDQILSDNSSALRMAQNMGADFILFVTLGSYAKEVKKFNNPNLGIKTENTVHNLRGTYRVAEGVTGSTLGGDSFLCSKTITQTGTLQVEDEDTLNGLLEEAAGKVADGLAAKASVFVPPATLGKVAVSIACGVKDLAGNEVTIPDLRITENNTIAQAGKELPAQASAVIEVDGFAMGTTPAQLKLAPGPHKLRLTRPGFTDVELTINATEGLSLTPTMQMSDEGFGRWKDIRSYLNGLDRSRKLTDAEVKDIEGHAQMLRQSGFKVDAKTDIKVDTKEGFKFNLYKSLY